MPPSNFYRDRWPYPASGSPQNPSTWAHPQNHPPRHLPPHQSQYRPYPHLMNEHMSSSQVPPLIRLRTGSYVAETEYGPYFEEEQTPHQHRGHSTSSSRTVDEYVHASRSGANTGDWIRPSVPDDGVAAQLTGRIEMLRQRIGAVERSRERDQRADWSETATQVVPQGVRWAYPAENRPGFWEMGYGGHYGHRQPERLVATARNPPGSAFQPVVSSSSLIRSNVPPPVVQPPETDAPPPPVTGHKVYILDCKSCGTFLSNRGMKAVLLLRPNIALFSTDAMPVNCSPQPITGQQPVQEDFEKHPQDVTDLVRQTSDASTTEPRVDEVLYARYFLPPKSVTMDARPEKTTPERSADVTNHSGSTPPLPRTCECLTQTLSCHGCGAGIGYMIVTPCTRCTAQQSISGRPGQPQRTANGHRFVFHHAEIVARERFYIPGQPGVHRYPWGIPPTASTHSPTPAQQFDSRSRVPSVDSEPKSPSIPVFQPHRDGNFIPIVSQVPARAPTRRVQNSGLKAGDVVSWHHLSRTGELGGVSLDDEYYSQNFVER
ncbi:FAM72 protein [Rhizoctonia solani AG-3 Rhs1AP]|uniref:FAM72 protein n=1 Tax=Rhizoctonia solani AG-3 Rhs1AP TaxID=1086054 RepID=X8JLZ1_9AGAM|nr:FAM72 protein [Rhizoctonia solani AG-3 Rhs1AP]